MKTMRNTTLGELIDRSSDMSVQPLDDITVMRFSRGGAPLGIAHISNRSGLTSLAMTYEAE